MISKKSRNLGRVLRVNAGITHVEPTKGEVEMLGPSNSDGSRMTTPIGDVIGPRKAEVFSVLFK